MLNYQEWFKTLSPNQYGHYQIDQDLYQKAYHAYTQKEIKRLEQMLEKAPNDSVYPYSEMENPEFWIRDSPPFL